MLLKDKIALVTGAAQGLGEGIADLFSREGATVALCDVKSKEGEKAAADISSKTGRRTRFYHMDVSRREEIAAVVRAVDADFGRIDVLVNCAGVCKPTPLLDMTEAIWDAHHDVNVRGPFFLCQEVCQIMMKKGGCKIVNIASDSGVAAFPDETAYASSKAALIALTRAIARDMGAHGIYCNAVCPGATMTPMLKESFLTGPEKEKEFASATALNRIARPEYIARVVHFLSCYLSDHVTGEHILATAGGVMGQ
jgi:NAD(P)-dependent dehydrogenase (short-subunit alcohol dehydrogenase family)